MSKASRARKEALNERSEDAERFGHAMLDCDPVEREKASAIILSGLEKKIRVSRAGGKSSKVEVQSLDDLMRAMNRQEINPPADWKERVAARDRADRELAEKQRAAAAQARSDRQREAEYRKDWEAERARRSGSTAAESARNINDAGRVDIGRVSATSEDVKTAENALNLRSKEPSRDE